MNVQFMIENAINELVSEFLLKPFSFFTEADAVSRFHQLLVSNSTLAQKVRTVDGYEVSIVHREYPTFFRFDDKIANKRLPKPARRGHYDTVILNPEFILTHTASAVTNRSINGERNESITPFQAVVEFKLDNLGWSSGRTRGAIAELGKLALSHESPLKYFVVLMRYSAPNMARWNKYWPQIESNLEKYPKIGCVFAVHWLSPVKNGAEKYKYGRWFAEV